MARSGLDMGLGGWFGDGFGWRHLLVREREVPDRGECGGGFLEAQMTEIFTGKLKSGLW